MWNEWNEAVVDDDFRLLAEIGIKLVRVFPLWSDFQPIEKVYGYGGDVALSEQVDRDRESHEHIIAAVQSLYHRASFVVIFFDIAYEDP